MFAKLIINADDYGLTESVCRGIIQASQSGVVSSTSVLVNLVSDTDIENLNKSGLPAGVHLALTVGKPTLPPDEIPDLVDEKGYFLKRNTPSRPVNSDGFVIFDSVPYEQIHAEFNAQVRKFEDFALIPSHLDSHHHIHADARVIEAIAEIAGEYNLPVRSIDMRMKVILRSRGVITNDNFESRFFGGGNITKRNFSMILADIKDGVTEMMCHPGLRSLELDNISGYSREREVELEVLESEEVTQMVLDSGVEIISWRNVAI